MKYSIISCSVIALLYACSPSVTPEKQPDSVQVATVDTLSDHIADSSYHFLYQINNDGLTDAIVLDKPTAESNGLYTQITFYITGMGKQAFSAEEGWDLITDDLNATNQSVSNRIFISRQGDEVFFVLLGYGYSSGGRETTVFRYKENESVTKLHDRSEAQTMYIQPYGEGDSLKAIILTADLEAPVERPDLSATGYISYYAPFLVYDLNSTMQVNMALTQAYNEEHYAWAGPTFSLHHLVYTPKDSPEVKRIIPLP